MIEIIPNLHPIFVHFTVALLSTAVLLTVIAPCLPVPHQPACRTVAQWNLWLGTVITLATALSGLQAYHTVSHDAASHVAMTDHRNWAILTVTLFAAAAIWSGIQARRQKQTGPGFVIVLAIAGVVLASTAWHGGELVYRHGLGVMSLPNISSDNHHHAHEQEQDTDHRPSMHSATSSPHQEHNHDDHAH